MPKPTVYAHRTKVPVVQSRSEIEKTLAKYGATSFAFANEPSRAMIGFKLNKRSVRFVLNMPKGCLPQRERELWRALLLVIKAKLEAVRAGITVFDDEFLAHIVMPNGQTVADLLRDQISAAYDTGQMPPLLIYRPSDE